MIIIYNYKFNTFITVFCLFLYQNLVNIYNLQQKIATSNIMRTKNWMALIGLTCAAFIFNTSEFIPIGLLTDIANDFSTTEAKAGMIISIYAFVVMLLSLPLMIVVSRFEMK